MRLKSYKISLLRLALTFLGLSLLVLSGCQKEKRSAKLSEMEIDGPLEVAYASGFDIRYYEDHIKLLIHSPFPEAEASHEFVLVDKKGVQAVEKGQVGIPLDRVISTSTTHIPMMEALGQEKKLFGFPSTGYITSAKTLERVKKGAVKEVGNGQNLNTELILSLEPEAIIAFAFDGSEKSLETFQDNGIPVIFNGDWLEQSPLGRAEWIKFFGVLFDRQKEADSIFSGIEKAYLEALEIARTADKRPTLFSGVLFKDQWNLPAGESFTAQLYKDANTKYLWEDSSGTGSLVLGFESVFQKAADADLWIGSGYYTSREELKAANAHYSSFRAFKEDKIYTFSKKKGENGGVVYFELAPVMPHVVLKDLIKVAHPELLPGYEPYFLQKLD